MNKNLGVLFFWKFAYIQNQQKQSISLGSQPLVSASLERPKAIPVLITSPVINFGKNSNTLRRTEPAKDNAKKADLFVHDSYVDKNNKIKKSNVGDKIPSLQPPINPTIRSSRDILQKNEKEQVRIKTKVNSENDELQSSKSLIPDLPKISSATISTLENSVPKSQENRFGSIPSLQISYHEVVSENSRSRIDRSESRDKKQKKDRDKSSKFRIDRPKSRDKEHKKDRHKRKAGNPNSEDSKGEDRKKRRKKHGKRYETITLE